MGLFSKKKGGTLFGNLIAKVANVATGGVLGARRVADLSSGNLAAINPLAKSESKAFGEYKAVVLNNAMNTGLSVAGGGIPTTFAGQPANYNASTDTYEMQKDLKQVTVNGSKIEKNPLAQGVGDWLDYFGKRFSQSTEFGVDKNILILVGALGIGGLLLYSQKN